MPLASKLRRTAQLELEESDEKELCLSRIEKVGELSSGKFILAADSYPVTLQFAEMFIWLMEENL